MKIVVSAFVLTALIGCSAPEPAPNSIVRKEPAEEISLENLDDVRVASILKNAPQGKEVTMSLENLTVVADAYAEGETPNLDNERVKESLLKYPTYQKVFDRYLYIHNQERPTGTGYSSYDPKKPGKKRIQEGLTFCLSAVPVKAKDGSRRFYVKEIQLTGFLKCWINGKEQFPPKYNKLKRSDIVNPEDVDWLLGVDDFTTIQIGKKQA